MIPAWAERRLGNAKGEPINFDNMAEFDGLPAPIRKMLTIAPFSYNPRQVREAWQRSDMTAEQYAADRMPATFARDVTAKGPPNHGA